MIGNVYGRTSFCVCVHLLVCVRLRAKASVHTFKRDF